jgi:hypothetical protein
MTGSLGSVPIRASQGPEVTYYHHHMNPINGAIIL